MAITLPLGLKSRLSLVESDLKAIRNSHTVISNPSLPRDALSLPPQSSTVEDDGELGPCEDGADVGLDDQDVPNDQYDEETTEATPDKAGRLWSGYFKARE